MTAVTSIEIARLSPAVGARVTGCDLHESLDEETFAVLHQALLDHGVLIFPGQLLTAPALDAFARSWGEPLVVPYLAAHAAPGHPAVLRVTNMGKENAVTESWHFDSAFFEHPPPLTILAAQELPEVGGDTMWANQYAAFEALSPTMQRLLSHLRAGFSGSLRDDDGGNPREVVTYHPVVRHHPVTGRPALATGHPDSVPHFEGMSEEESRPLIEFLYRHASRPEFIYRHRWGQGDVVMWDNRRLLHYAIHDYGDAVRNLFRVTVMEPLRLPGASA